MRSLLSLSIAKSNKKLEKFVADTEVELKKFFKHEALKPLIFFVNDRKTLDIVWGSKTEEWFVGAAKSNNIYIIHPKLFSKLSSHREEEFWQILKHEYCHIYYQQITRGNKPIWLNEGLACYFSGKKLIAKEDYKSKVLKVFSYFDQSDKDVYFVGQFWVEQLISRYGREKLIELIKACSTISNEKQFKRKFLEIYELAFTAKSLAEFIN